jgi:hypothetical protein
MTTARTNLGAPHQPQLEDVVVSTALNHFVARVVSDVVVFVLLEQIIGAHLIAINQKTLRSGERMRNDCN